MHQMRRLKPTMQFDMAGLENGANRNREFAVAWPAVPQSRATAPNRRDPIKAAAACAERPVWPHHCFELSNRSGFVMKMWPGKNAHD
jgi:hypothetical protein